MLIYIYNQIMHILNFTKEGKLILQNIIDQNHKIFPINLNYNSGIRLYTIKDIS